MTPDPKKKRHPLPRGWVKRLGETNEIMLQNLPREVKPAQSPYRSIRKRVFLERLKKNPQYEKIMESKTVQDLAVNLGMKLFEGIPKNVLNSGKSISKMPLKERMAIYNEVAPKVKSKEERVALALALRLQEASKKA